MTILLKSLLLLGVFALLGPGVAARHLRLRPGEGLGRWARACLWLGALLVVLASLGSVTLIVSSFSGGLEPALTLEYLRSSRHGQVTLLRLALVLALLWLGLGGRLPRLEPWLYALVALGFLATLSLSAHAGAAGGWLPVAADVGHLAAAALWIGAVIGLAFLPSTQKALAARIAPRVSQAGLVSVLILIASGVYSATLHLFAPSALTTSAYGQTLLVKLGLVAVILGIAALNRWWLLPAFRRSGAFVPLRRLVRLELLLLAAVLIATGALASTEPASPSDVHENHAPHGPAIMPPT